MKDPIVQLHIRPNQAPIIERTVSMSLLGACYHLSVCLQNSGTDFTLILPGAHA